MTNSPELHSLLNMINAEICKNPKPKVIDSTLKSARRPSPSINVVFSYISSNPGAHALDIIRATGYSDATVHRALLKLYHQGKLSRFRASVSVTAKNRAHNRLFVYAVKGS